MTGSSATMSGSADAIVPSGGVSILVNHDRSHFAGDPGDLWLSRISTLSQVQKWEQRYTAEFGSAPALSPMPALYYDAASLLIHRLWQVSRIVNGNLLINRAALASAVRNTTNYWGVSCTITLDPATGNRLNDPAALQRCVN